MPRHDRFVGWPVRAGAADQRLSVLPEGQWRGYRPTQEPPAAAAGSVGSYRIASLQGSIAWIGVELGTPGREPAQQLAHIRRPCRIPVALARLVTDMMGNVMALTDPENRLAAALASLGRAFMARDS